MAWEALLVMEEYDIKGTELDEGGATPGTDLARAFERVRLEVVWKWAMPFGFLEKVLFFFFFGRVQFEECAADLLQTITATLVASNGRCCG